MRCGRRAHRFAILSYGSASTKEPATERRAVRFTHSCQPQATSSCLDVAHERLGYCSGRERTFIHGTTRITAVARRENVTARHRTQHLRSTRARGRRAFHLGPPHTWRMIRPLRSSINDLGLRDFARPKIWRETQGKKPTAFRCLDPRVFHHFRRCPYSVLFRERPRKQRNRLAASYPTTIDKHPRINTDMLGWGGSVVGFFGFV